MKQVKRIILLIFGVLLILNCEKQPSDFRDKYLGDWEFTVYSYTSDLILGNYGYDTVFYTGVINYGINNDELLIQYTEDYYKIVILDSGLHFHFWITSNCNGSGEFEGSNKLGFYYSCGDLSRKTHFEIIGEKKHGKSTLNKAPSAIANAAKGGTLNGAMLTGTVNPNYLFTDVSFEYGLTQNYGNTTTTGQSSMFGSKNIEVGAYVTGLLPSTLYHYRVNAKNLMGDTHGMDMIFTTLKPTDPITDIDGNVYQTVPIGNQIWMGENLRTNKYSNGDVIITTTPATLDISKEDSPKYQWYYDGEVSNVTDYGRLYTWYTTTDSRNVCPAGWHVPSNAEWTTLLNNLGDNAGRILKETGTKHWIEPNDANNGSGFTALPGGFRYSSGLFKWVGEWGNWWSSN